MGLDMSNSNFDRFYQQDEVVHDGVTVRAAKNGAVEFVEDQHHRAPLLFHDGNLLVGTDNGLVLFYPVL